MAITTQLVGKLGGAKWETVEIPETTVTGSRSADLEPPLASITVPDGKLFVGYATCNISNQVNGGQYSTSHEIGLAYPKYSIYSVYAALDTVNVTSVTTVPLAFAPGITSTGATKKDVRLAVIGGASAYGTYPATSTTVSGILKYMLLDL